MNTPNINAEQLPLPPGHRWVDIANEPFTREAKFWHDGWTREDGGYYELDWSYCIPVSAGTPTPGPEPAIHPGPVIGLTVTLPGRDTIQSTTADAEGHPMVLLENVPDITLYGWPHWRIFAAEVAGRVLHVALTRTEETR